MEKHIQKMKKHTDLWPWYWLSYGEKEYAFAVVEAYPLHEGGPVPTPGSKLEKDEEASGNLIWIGDNGAQMIIEAEISNIEQQNGDTICSFIAASHAHFFNDELATFIM